MDGSTVATYERAAAEYAAARTASAADRARRFAAGLSAGGRRLDLGCGPGLYLPHLGRPIVAADAALAMVQAAVGSQPDVPGVRCDLTRLPFRRGAFAGVWASKAHQHVEADALPGALGELHHALPVGGRLELTVFGHDGDEDVRSIVTGGDDQFPGRLFTLWQGDALRWLLVGAGFDVERLSVEEDRPPRFEVTAVRARTLADTVAPGMRLLVCGLNPSIYSADAGVGYARPGNRFWPALRLAGLSEVDRDGHRLLREDHIGITDLVKRPTVAAAELRAEEYRTGLARVDRLCRLLRPAAVCFVGLAGWRAAVDRRAAVGWQDRPLGDDTPAYVMPSTSGLNARTPLTALADHLATAAAGP
ncbi:MAG: methyltransferase domain-containing protein [Acidimicrobiia bacterium]|nr:methyltransferase domain-containing protein [Acidimicrobiia bacterium]